MDDFNGFHVTMDKFVILFDITNNSKEAQFVFLTQFVLLTLHLKREIFNSKLEEGKNRPYMPTEYVNYQPKLCGKS